LNWEKTRLKVWGRFRQLHFFSSQVFRLKLFKSDSLCLSRLLCACTATAEQNFLPEIIFDTKKVSQKMLRMFPNKFSD
jgi:hypothetical protein